MQELTVRDLRHALVGVPDDLPVRLSSDTGVDQGMGDIIIELARRGCTLTGLRSGKGVLAHAANEYRKSILQIIQDQPTAMGREKTSPVGGVDRSEQIDRISIENAVETPFWMAVWAAEPGRMIDVRMSYDDLKTLCDLIDKRQNDGWIPVSIRLPEKAGTYIINALDGERDIVTFAKWQNGYKRFDMTGARSYWRIIAWRPLPEPYLPERSEGE